jgi:hypothetical protein
LKFRFIFFGQLRRFGARAAFCFGFGLGAGSLIAATQDLYRFFRPRWIGRQNSDEHAQCQDWE